MSLAELVAGLSDPDDHGRFNAIRELVNSGPVAAHAWPEVSCLQSDARWMVRLEVVRGTYLLGVPSEEAIPLLTQFLCDENAIVRSYAKWALEEKYGQRSQSASS